MLTTDGMSILGKTLLLIKIAIKKSFTYQFFERLLMLVTNPIETRRKNLSI